MDQITQNAGRACCESCGPDAEQDTALAIACTLGAGDFKARVAAIQALASRSLVSSRREPLRLHLMYVPDALAEVEDLVAEEAECCNFLHFDLQNDSDAVRLTITAPIAALPAADELFAHFAPELARDAA